MLEAIDSPEVLLANGNWMKGADKDHYTFLLKSHDLKQKLQEHKEASIREKQFCELILHVIEQIDKECEDLPDDRDLWTGVSLLDMKKFLKADVSVTGVSENSPIFILESVHGKVGQILHNFNIYEICQLAACTKVEFSHIAKQVSAHQVNDLEFALQDAKSIMEILSAEKEHKAKEPTNAWNSWGNLTQVSNLLQIKENSQKIANFMGVLSTKHITTSILDALTGQPREEEDIDSFETI